MPHKDSAFPILRYDNGDTAVATRKEKNGRYRLYLDELYGRRSDLIYDCEGKAITPYIITNNLWDIEGVKLRVKEKTAPSITITAPSADAYITTVTPAIEFQVKDTDSGVNAGTIAVTVDGTAVSNITKSCHVIRTSLRRENAI